MEEMEKTLSEKLRELAEMDIRTVDPSTLVEIENVRIHENLPVQERVADYVRQIKNPYCYLSHGTVVKVSFTGKRSLEDCLESCALMET